MENTEELEIDVDDIGAILKSNRLKNKKSLEEVSAELCIRKIYLTALEEGDYETLPPIPYGIGYVRTYANYLGLSSDRAVKLYKASALIEEQKEELPESPEINKSNNNHLFLGVITIFLIYGSWYAYDTFYKKNIKTPLVISSGIVESEEVNQNVKVEENEENISTKAVVSKDEFEEDETAEFSKNEAQQTENQLINVSQNEKQEQISDSQETPADNITEPQLNSNKVEIKFNGESWIELKNKNKVYFQGVFHEGDVKSVDYTSDLFISVGRPDNVDVYVKGIKKNLLAKRRKTNIPVDSLD